MPATMSRKSGSLAPRRIMIPLILLHCFAPIILEAQCITNNTIELQPNCSGIGLAILKGSLPIGGNGSYSYTWEKNRNENCKNEDFVRIADATGPDYIIPMNNEAEA